MIIFSKNVSADSRVQITEGQHTYPFSFQLPHNLPSSFEHNYGHVRYTVKAVIDRPWKFDHQSKCAFTVVAALDLNTHPEIRVRNHYSYFQISYISPI